MPPKKASPTKKKTRETKNKQCGVPDVVRDAPGDAPAQNTEPDDADLYHEPVIVTITHFAIACKYYCQHIYGYRLRKL
jgi:hypothetical protein